MNKSSMNAGQNQEKGLAQAEQRIARLERQAQVEAALERVRTRAMAMTSSDDLADAIAVVFREVEKLGISTIRCGITILDAETKSMETWIATSTEEGHEAKASGRLKIAGNPTLKKVFDAWKRGEAFLSYKLTGKALERYYKSITHDLPLPEREAYHSKQVVSLFFFAEGGLYAYTAEPLSPEASQIFEKFTRVFALTYRRYLDLKQAEEQAREAQIEATLERIRNRTLLMKDSGELNEAVAVFFQQFKSLNLLPAEARTYFCHIDANTRIAEVWMTHADGTVMQGSHFTPLNQSPSLKKFYQAWKRKEPINVRNYSGKELKEYLQFVSTLPHVKTDKDYRRLFKSPPDRIVMTDANFLQGCIGIMTFEPLSREALNVLVRFAKVFEFTYTRFLDLQKAEAQAREAQIEAALERVRAAGMAMHQSEQLAEVVAVVHEQLSVLGFDMGGCFIDVFDEENQDLYLWIATPEKKYARCFHVPYFEHPLITALVRARKKRKAFFTDSTSRQQKNVFFDYVFKHSDLKHIPTERKALLKKSKGLARSVAMTKYAALILQNYDGEPFSEEENDIIGRFARVFEQTYTRFLDLQKAEAQAREAQIEVALERVRARTMAMHKSEELAGCAQTLFDQLRDLGVNVRSAWFSIFSDDRKSIRTYFTDIDAEFQQHFTYQRISEYSNAKGYMNAWKNREPIFLTQFEGLKLKDYVTTLAKDPSFKKTNAYKVFNRNFDNCWSLVQTPFQQGYLGYGTFESPTAEDLRLLPRFGKVFEQTYTRFTDIQKAEAQAREAQIEAALERVRARTMAMHHSDELTEAASVLFQQLQELGIPALRRCWIHIIHEDASTWDSWGTDEQGESGIVDFTVPASGHPVFEKMVKAWKQRKPFSSKLEGAELQDLVKFSAKHGFVYPKGEKPPPHMIFSPYPFSHGMLNPVTYEPVTEKDFDLLRRFARVFEQTYRRFLDLKQAEEQAREAQIEASLERVRAAGMAMHHSSDLQKAILVVFDQLRELGIEMDFSGIHIFENGKRDFNLWIATPGRDYSEQVHIPHRRLSTFDNFFDARERGDTFLVESFSKRQKDAFFSPDLADIIASKRIKLIREAPGWMRVSAMTKHTALIVASYDRRPFAPLDCEIIKRIAKVFEQTYTRFLDLQKAEAQAREAQIEAAMERIRSRAIAMRSSNELKDVIIELRRQIDSLGQLDLEASVIHLYPEGADMFESFAAVRPPGESGEIVVANVFFPVDVTEHIKRMIEMYHSDQSEYTIQFDKKAAEAWQEVMIEHAPMIAERREGFVENRRTTDNPEFWNFADFSHGSLLLVTHSPASNDTYEVLRKAAQVFDQAYTRFLDLQKAEAQAREAQIEAALERVRSRSMAMHKSEELNEVVSELYQQIQSLEFTDYGCTIIICKLESKVLEHWYAGEDQVLSRQCYNVPLTDQPVSQKQWNSWLEGVLEFKIYLKGKDKADYTEFMLNETDHKYFPDDVKAEWRAPEDIYFYYVRMEYGLLEFVNVEPFDEENFPVYRRFAKVFEQTYTRFLDLKQAEAQAREAQIEAALERVRSRTMAMHKTEDFSEIVLELFNQMSPFGLAQWGFGLWLLDETSKGFNVWFSTPNSRILPDHYHVPALDYKVLVKIREALKKQSSYYPIELEYQDKWDWDMWLFENTGLKKLPPEVKEEILAAPYVQFSFSAMKYGLLQAIDVVPMDPKLVPILGRFSKVIQQTYTRFLDLQKAESQAREAQIEAALERVRAAGMAMHHSEDLAEASTILFEQLADLGLEARRVGFALPDDEKQEFTIWSTIRGDDGKASLLSAFLYYDQHPIYPKMIGDWHEGKKMFSYELHGRDLQNYYKSWNKTFETPKALLKTLKENTSEYYQFASFDQGMIYAFTAEPLSEDQHQLLLRFANAFELTYTRFLDLKKAEAQARESQIEAALERVRAASMAMHKSDELLDVVRVLFDQLADLGLKMDASVIYEFVDNGDDHHFWVKAAGQNYTERVHLPYFKHPYFLNFKKARADGTPFMTNNFSKKQKDVWFTHFFAKSSLRTVPQKRKDYIFSCEGMNQSVAHTKNTAVGIFRYNTIPFSEEENDVLQRMAQVFEQSYTRFLDLKQAEEQAREAQIEASLERVRARTMAMHTSDELREAVAEVFEEFKRLDFSAATCSIGIFNETTRSSEWWIANAVEPSFPRSYHVPYLEGWPNDWYQMVYDNWRQGVPFFECSFKETEKHRLDHKLMTETEFGLIEYGMEDLVQSDDNLILSYATLKHGVVEVGTTEPIPQDQIHILQRFAKVIDLCYTRFDDLQQAEAQAREAQIEAGLERIRARTMAMQKSQELQETSLVLFQQFRELGAQAEQLSIGVINEEEKTLEVSATLHGRKLEQTYNIKVDEQAVARKIYQAWKARGKSAVIEISGQELDDYNKWRNSLAKTKVFSTEDQAPSRWIINMAFFSRGVLSFSTHEAVPAETIRLLERFAGVFDLTYTRFLDLQQAEARAREALQQASLDRVRAEIASMRSADDLQRITPVIWRELTTLGVPFFRCGVFIIDETAEQAHAYLSTPTGKSLAALHLKFDSTPLIEQTVQHWRESKTYREEWDREQFIEWTQTILSQGLIDSPEQYQAGGEAPEKLVLQLVPFKQGMLYVGSTSPLSDDEIDSVRALAGAFAVAYARYEDFQRLEAAKAEVETAFRELGILSKQLEAKNAELESENARKARELEEARRLQLAMLPKTVPTLPDLQIAVYMKTATEVGGDYYDFHVAADGTLTAAIGDATGHGLQAGTMVTVTKSLFSSLAKEPDIVSTFRDMNSTIKSMKLPLLSMCLAMLKIKDGEMKLSSAGIPPALIYRSASKSVEEVTISGMPLGAMKRFPYRQKEIALEPSDTILLMSDGFPERMNEKEEMFDYPRAQEVFAEVAKQAPRRIVKHLVKSCDAWANGRPQDDDVTFVVIKCTPR